MDCLLSSPISPTTYGDRHSLRDIEEVLAEHEKRVFGNRYEFINQVLDEVEKKENLFPDQIEQKIDLLVGHLFDIYREQEKLRRTWETTNNYLFNLTRFIRYYRWSNLHCHSWGEVFQKFVARTTIEEGFHYVEVETEGKEKKAIQLYLPVDADQLVYDENLRRYRRIDVEDHGLPKARKQYRDKIVYINPTDNKILDANDVILRNNFFNIYMIPKAQYVDSTSFNNESTQFSHRFYILKKSKGKEKTLCEEDLNFHSNKHRLFREAMQILDKSNCEISSLLIDEEKVKERSRSVDSLCLEGLCLFVPSVHEKKATSVPIYLDLILPDQLDRAMKLWQLNFLCKQNMWEFLIEKRIHEKYYLEFKYGEKKYRPIKLRHRCVHNRHLKTANIPKGAIKEVVYWNPMRGQIYEGDFSKLKKYKFKIAPFSLISPPPFWKPSADEGEDLYYKPTKEARARRYDKEGIRILNNKKILEATINPDKLQIGEPYTKLDDFPNCSIYSGQETSTSDIPNRTFCSKRFFDSFAVFGPVVANMSLRMIANQILRQYDANPLKLLNEEVQTQKSKVGLANMNNVGYVELSHEFIGNLRLLGLFYYKINSHKVNFYSELSEKERDDLYEYAYEALNEFLRVSLAEITAILDEADCLDEDLKDRGYREAVTSLKNSVAIRYIAEIYREEDEDINLPYFFAQIALAMHLINNDHRVVALTIDGMEHGETSQRFYSMHIDIIRWLKKKTQCTALAPHGGEFYFGMSELDKKTMKNAVRTLCELGVGRIGHALSMGLDDKVVELIQLMKKTETAVEICPTSNYRLTGLHLYYNVPLEGFCKAKLPIVVCTDNQGLFNVSLQEEIEHVCTATSFHSYRNNGISKGFDYVDSIGTYFDFLALSRNGAKFSFPRTVSIYNKEGLLRRPFSDVVKRERWKPSQKAIKILALSPRALKEVLVERSIVAAKLAHVHEILEANLDPEINNLEGIIEIMKRKNSPFFKELANAFESTWNDPYHRIAGIVNFGKNPPFFKELANVFESKWNDPRRPNDLNLYPVRLRYWPRSCQK